MCSRKKFAQEGCELSNYIFESEKTPTEYPALIPHEYGMNPPRIRHESGHIPIPFFATTVLLHRLSKLSLAGAHAELSQEDSQQKFNIKNRKELPKDVIALNKLEDNSCRLMGMDVTWSSLQNQPRSSVFVQIGL